MKWQWSLRTLLIVMTLGGPMLAGVIQVSPKVIRSLFPYEEEAHRCCLVITVTWAAAMREAQQVQALSRGFQTSDKRELQPKGNCPPQSSLQSEGNFD